MIDPENMPDDPDELRETVIRELAIVEQRLAALYSQRPDLFGDLDDEWIAAQMVADAPELFPDNGPTPDLISAFQRLRARLEADR
jgi:hypothetical protein